MAHPGRWAALTSGTLILLLCGQLFRELVHYQRAEFGGVHLDWAWDQYWGWSIPIGLGLALVAMPLLQWVRDRRRARRRS